MKPERTRDQLSSNGNARAKMFLKAHLDWLDGSPYAQSPGQIHWQTRPRVGATEVTRLVVDRELLRQSHEILVKLTRHFPNAMPKLVGDVEVWAQSVTLMLDRLKSAVHGDLDIVHAQERLAESLPRIEKVLVNRLSQQDPAFTELLRVVLWSGSHKPGLRSFLVTWIAENASWIQDYLKTATQEAGLRTILLSADLTYTDGPEIEAVLRATLADSQGYRTPTEGLRDEVSRFADKLRTWRSSQAPPPVIRRVASTQSEEVVVAFLAWVARQSRAVRKTATRLAGQVLSTSLAREWNSGWDSYFAEARTAIRKLVRLARQLGGVAFHTEACRISYELEDQFKTEPMSYPVSQLLRRVKDIATERSPRYCKALTEFLTVIPVERDDGTPDQDGLALRMAVLFEAGKSTSELVEARYYELSRKYLLANRAPLRLRLWGGQIQSVVRPSSYSGSSPRHVFLTLSTEWQRANFFTLLGRVCQLRSYSYVLNNEIGWLLTACKSVEEAYKWFLELAPKGLLNDCNKVQVHAAIELVSDQLPLVEALELIGPESKVESFQISSLMALHRSMADAGWQHLVASILRKGQAAELVRTASEFAFVTEHRSVAFARYPQTVAIPGWADHLPTALHRAISTFATVFPDCRAKILGILGKCFPEREKLQSEIDFLQKEIERSHEGDGYETNRVPLAVKQRRRLENLNQRLAKPVVVSDETIHGLNHDLDEALLMEVFRDVNRRIDEQVIAVMGGTVGLRQLADHWNSTRNQELIRGILELEEPYRHYALKLVGKEWGGTEWDLSQEPANRRFVQSLVDRGIRVEAWQKPRTRLVPAEGEQPEFTLAFETNEVEKLLMGYYFGTCLSPDDCNFYSAVANAIDINKRVLYGRDGQDVIGRCLLAIGDAGTVVAFRPYRRGAEYKFEEHVAQFVNELANEMGTVVSHTDHVSPVLAPSWYDDGSYDLGNSVTSEQSPVRLAIQQATEATILAVLETALLPRGLTDSMLELIVELPEFQSRPELIRPLHSVIQSCEDRLGISTLVTAASLAHKAGINEVAEKWMIKYAPGWLNRHLNRDDKAVDILQLLLRFQPSLALRVLRSTRPKGIQVDDEEIDNQRRGLLADCFEALGRPRQAAALRVGSQK